MTELFNTLSSDEARQYSPLTLAFVGDSVYEQLVRTELALEANRPANELHKAAVELVNANYQSKAAAFLADNGFTEEENYIFKRGRNAHGITAPKSAKNSDYRAATGLEAVFGYLALTGRQDRCRELYAAIRNGTKI